MENQNNITQMIENQENCYIIHTFLHTAVMERPKQEKYFIPEQGNIIDMRTLILKKTHQNTNINPKQYMRYMLVL